MTRTPLRVPHRRALPAWAASALVTTLAVASAAFTPATALAAGTAVPLGSAATFGVLAGQSVASTGPTRVTGDLGVSPGASITGFPPGTVTGATHAADAASQQAQTDLTTAYDDAAAQPAGANIALDLGGITLTPDVYHASGPISVTGTLTLDAQGDPNAVFVFQLNAGLTTAPASRIVLANGARSANVFWQVAGSAGLGAGSTFTGDLMALTSISAGTGATIDGRALARTGTVMLSSTTLACPGCGGGDDGGGGDRWPHRPPHRGGHPWNHRGHHHRHPYGAPRTGAGGTLHGDPTEAAAGFGLLGLTTLGAGAFGVRRRST